MNDEFANLVDKNRQVPDTTSVTNIHETLPKHHLFASPFGIGQKVKITSLEREGKVIQLSWDERGLRVTTQYVDLGHAFCIKIFQADELETIK